jgi:hypothetical protein
MDLLTAYCTKNLPGSLFALEKCTCKIEYGEQRFQKETNSGASNFCAKHFISCLIKI